MKPLLLLTMSGSGGKWLASTIAGTVYGCRYYDKEYFNPWCNERRELALVRNFGCEMASCYRNIALPGDANISQDIEDTWGEDGYTFTKEVYSAFKAQVFIDKGFHLFGLVRKTDDVLPPLRSQVWNFYEHTWCALRDAGHRVTAVRARDRAREAHSMIRRKIIEDGERLGFKVLEFDFLQSASEQGLYEELARATGVTTRGTASALVQTRFREA